MTRMEEVATEAMYVHYAHLIDNQVTDVRARDGISNAHDQVWAPSCSFPSMDEDLLLYLAVMGGVPWGKYRRYGNYDMHSSSCISTWQMFMMYLEGKGFASDEAAVTEKDFKTYENAVAHMVFCASRRNGVQGISFDDFFSGLLGEFQNAVWMMEMTEGDTKNTIKATDLLDGYTALNISEMKIPFLSPPNAKWPEFILAANTAGCNFGHLTHTSDKVVYVQDSNGEMLLICDCKHGAERVDSIK